MASNNIRFDLQVTGGTAVAGQFKKVASEIAAFAAAVKASQEVLKNSFVRGIASSNNFTLQFVTGTRKQINAEAERVRQAAITARALERQREKEARDRERAAKKALRDQKKAVEERHRILVRAARRAKAARAKEETDRKRALGKRLKDEAAAAARVVRAEAQALAKRLAQQRAFYARLAGLAQTGNAAVIRALGSIGLAGPALRGVSTSIGKTFEKLGTQGGKSFAGSLVRSLTTGLAAIPKVIGDIAGPLLQAFGAIVKSFSASIPALAGTIGATLGAALAPFSAGLAAIIPVVTSTMGVIVGVFGGGIGGISQLLGGLVQGVGSAFSSVLSVAGSALASLSDILVDIGSKVFGTITSLVSSTLSAITGGISKVFGSLTGLAGKAIKTLLSPATLLVTALSVKATKDINDKIIDAFALLDDRSSFHLGNVRGSIFELSRAVGVSSSEIATLLFDVISAGFRDSASAFEILQRASELAVAGSASVASSGEAIVSSLIAQKRGAEDSAEAMRFLFALQDRGRLTVQDASQAVAGLSASMIAGKIPAEELAGSFAALSLQGIPAAAVTTQLRELILNLAAPTPLAAAAMRSLGIELHNLSDGDREFLDSLRAQIDAQEERLATTERGTQSYREQRAELTKLKQEFSTQQRVKGQFVGISEAVKRVSEALARGGDEAIRFARVIVPRKRARDALAFLAENFALLIEKISQATEDFGKFDTALVESQQKVGVELTKTVTALRQLGVEIFNLGTEVTGGRGFELVRAAIDRIRGGIVSLQGAIPGIKDAFISIAGSIREAFRPITDLGLSGAVQRLGELIVNTLRGAFSLIGVDISKFVDNAESSFSRVGEYARVAFDIAIGAANEFSEIFTGALSFQDSAIGSLLSLAGSRVEQLFVALKQRFYDFRDVAVGALGGAFLSVRELLIGVVQLFSETVSKVVSGLPSGLALIPLFLFGPKDIDVGGFIKGVVREIEASASAFATKGLVLSGADFDIDASPIAESLRDVRTAAAEAHTEVLQLGFAIKKAEEERAVLQARTFKPEVLTFDRDPVADIDKKLDKLRASEKQAIANQQELIKLAAELNAKKAELSALHQTRLAESAAEQEQVNTRKDALEEEIALETERLGALVEGLKIRGEASRDAAAASREAARLQREEAALRAEAIKDVRDVARFEGRRIDLAEKLGLQTEKQERRLNSILNSVSRIAEKEVTAEEKAKELADQFERLVKLSADAGINVEQLAEALDKAGKGAGILQGIGNLTKPTGTPLAAPTGGGGGGNVIPLLDAILGVTESQTNQTVGSFEGGIDDLKRFLGQGLTVSFAPKSASMLERLAGGTAFQQAIAKAFRDFGQPKPGVGGFIAQAGLERGEGFLPLEGLPKELIQSFETTLGPSAPVVTRLQALIEAIEDLQTASRTGEIPGQRLGAAQGFQATPGGDIVGVRADALQSDLVQQVLQGIASRETVLELLDKLGLQQSSLEGIKKILEEQLLIERGLGDVDPRDLGAAERGLARGQAAAASGAAAAFGPGTISFADTDRLVKLQKQLSTARAEEALAAQAQLSALAKLQAAATQLAVTQSPQALAEVAIATKAYEEAVQEAEAASKKASGEAGEFGEVLEGTSGKATAATKAFAGLQSVLEVFSQLDLEKTGKSLAEFAKELGADKSLQRLLEKAEKDPGGAEAGVVDQAKAKQAGEQEAAKDPAQEALENLAESEAGWADFTAKIQEDSDNTKVRVEELGTSIDTTGTSAEVLREKISETGLAAEGAFSPLGFLIEQIRALRDASAEIAESELGTKAQATRESLESLLREAREKQKDVEDLTKAKPEKEGAKAKGEGDKAVLEALKAAEDASRQSEEILAERSKAMSDAVDVFRSTMRVAVEGIISGFNATQQGFFDVRTSFEEVTIQLTDVVVPAIEQNADEVVTFAETATASLESIAQTLETHTTELASLSARVAALGG